jgi:O-antigen ligase/Tfp pilus assembly protein PilF
MNKTAYWILAFALVFSPLAFGAVEQWSMAVMEALSFIALSLVLLRSMKHKEPFLHEVPGIVPLSVFLAYMLIQLIPLPPALLKVVSPGAYKLYAETLWLDATKTWASISINKKSTAMELFRILSYAAFYVATVQLLSRKELLKKTVVLIIVFASLLSFFSILQHILSNGKIYWIRELTHGKNPFGPYVNRNHYAGLMEMLFPVVLSLFLAFKPHVTYSSLREKMAEIFKQNSTNVHILLGFSAVIIATSIFLSLSRGGITSLSLSIIFLSAVLIYKEGIGKRGILIIIVAIMIALSVGWFGWGPIIKKFQNISITEGDSLNQRVEIWINSAGILKDFPATGAGFGSFLHIYPGYRNTATDFTDYHAHNDYIELLTDGGIVGFLLAGWFMLEVFYKTFGNFLKRKEQFSIYLYAGALTGIISLLIHSFTDFNMHIGANGLFFFFMAGIAVSASCTRMRNNMDKTYLRKIRIPSIKKLALASAVVLLSNITFNARIIAGEQYFSSVKGVRINDKISREELLFVRDMAQKASFFDPMEARYRFASANIENRLLNSREALRNYNRSIALNPSKGEYLQRLGLFMSDNGNHEKAGVLLQAGIGCEPGNVDMRKRHAAWLLSRGNKHDGLEGMRAAMSLDPRRTKEFIATMALYGITEGEMKGALPDRVEPHLLFADYLYNTGKEDMAGDEYMHALDFIGKEKEAEPSYFYAAYLHFNKMGLNDVALAVMKKAIEALPVDSGIRLTAGDAYLKAGITYRAKEEYRKALILDPENKKARKKLDEIR